MEKEFLEDNLVKKKKERVLDTSELSKDKQRVIWELKQSLKGLQVKNADLLQQLKLKTNLSDLEENQNENESQLQLS